MFLYESIEYVHMIVDRSRKIQAIVVVQSYCRRHSGIYMHIFNSFNTIVSDKVGFPLN